MKHFLIIAGAVIAGLIVSYYMSQSNADKAVDREATSAQENVLSPATDDTAQKQDAGASEQTQEEKATQSPLITAAAENARVYFIQPSNGDVVSSPVKIVFGAENMAVVKAGDQSEFSGHHHLLVDYDGLPDMSMPLPATDNLIHFGGGQTETELSLPPGEYTLQMLLGNWAHVPHQDPVISEKITIKVQ